MNIKVVRKNYTDKSTIADLSIDGVHYCFVLEDKVRGTNESKVFGKTAIPAGKYRVVISFSNRFQRYLPEVLEVPGFQGIRIHEGNTEADSLGCLILGNKKAVDSVFESKKATTSFIAKLKAVEKKEKIYIEIVDTKR